MFKRALFVAIALMLLMLEVPISAQTETPVDGKQIKAVIEFNQALSLEETIQMLNQLRLTPLIFESDFTVGSSTYHEFHLVDSDLTSKNPRDEFVENRLALLADMGQLAASMSAEQRSALGLSDETIYAANAQPTHEVAIVKVTVVGDPAALAQISQQRNEGRIGTVQIEESNTNASDSALQSHSQVQAEVTAATEEVVVDVSASTWHPARGTSYAASSQAGGRYMDQFMQWDSVSFGANQTYEHDFFLYNYDRQTYLDGNSTSYPGCFPVVTYAVTSWPAAAKPYLDTRLANNLIQCEVDELAFTIGAARANQLQANVMYHNYIRTANGNATSDKFKVQAQVGHRSPDGCDTTWCSFGDENVRLVPAWSDAVPGTREWERVGSCPSDKYYAEYYNNVSLAGDQILTRCESWPIAQSWGSGGPGKGVNNDNFSARWTARVQIDSGRYNFIARSDDGIRVWIDNNLIIDAWRDQGATEYRHTRDVGAGYHNIKVEYYERGGDAIAQFRWERVNTNSGNLALNRPAYATSQESTNYVPAKGNDGNVQTRWSSRISTSLGNEWWWSDLGTQTFDRVSVRWEAAYPARYFIGWSNDGVNFSGYWYSISGPGVYNHNVNTRTARYVGMMMNTRAPRMNNYSFWELEVYRTASTSASLENGLTDNINEATDIAPEGDVVTISLSASTESNTLFLPLIHR